MKKPKNSATALGSPFRGLGGFAMALLLLSSLALTPACKRKAPLPEEPPAQTANQAEKAEEPKKVEIEIVREEPKDGLGPGTDEQQQLLIRAKSAFLNEQWDEAEARFKELTQTQPVSGPVVTAYIALGQIYNDSDRAQSAQELYEELLKKAPKVPEVHFVMARTLAEQGDTTKAMREYEMTVKLQPDYLQAIVELAGLYAKSGRKEEAEKLFFSYEKKVYDLAGTLEKKDTPPEEKLRILEIFSFVDDDRANQAIAKTVLDPDPTVRERAIWLAVDLDIASIRPQLEVLGTADPDRRVRLAAKEAMRQLKGGDPKGDQPVRAK